MAAFARLAERRAFPPAIIRSRYTGHGQSNYVSGRGGGPARVTTWGEGKNRSRKSWGRCSRFVRCRTGRRTRAGTRAA
jgi:hypothetical protein